MSKRQVKRSMSQCSGAAALRRRFVSSPSTASRCRADAHHRAQHCRSAAGVSPSPACFAATRRSSIAGHPHAPSTFPSFRLAGMAAVAIRASGACATAGQPALCTRVRRPRLVQSWSASVLTCRFVPVLLCLPPRHRRSARDHGAEGLLRAWGHDTSDVCRVLATGNVSLQSRQSTALPHQPGSAPATPPHLCQRGTRSHSGAEVADGMPVHAAS